MLNSGQDIIAVVIGVGTILGVIVRYAYSGFKKLFLSQEDFDAYKESQIEKNKEFENRILVAIQKTVDGFSDDLDKKVSTKELEALKETVKLQSDQVNKLLAIWEKQDYKIQLLSGLKTELTATIKDIKLELGDKMENLKEEVKSSLEETRNRYDIISHENSEMKVCIEGIKKEVEYLRKEH